MNSHFAFLKYLYWRHWWPNCKKFHRPDFIFKDSFGILNIRAKKFSSLFSSFMLFHSPIIEIRNCRVKQRYCRGKCKLPYKIPSSTAYGWPNGFFFTSPISSLTLRSITTSGRELRMVLHLTVAFDLIA